MTMNRAIDILGINNMKGSLQNMVRAFDFPPWLNTDEENQRATAGRYVLNRWRTYQVECNSRRPRR
tara:strand:- start:2271 stop:2468 length:198 start_codon:yes stop_codon:yes gene_type:complete